MWKKVYEEWLNYKDLNELLRQDLESKNETELEDMFYTNLSFGTGGMRGVLGAGTNRLNIYTIRRANNGLAKYLVKNNKASDLSRGVVIAHDNRHFSREFAIESAKVLGAYGIKSYLFEDLRPTPELSYAVRQTKALAGIVVTASHNPPAYNGYKIYDEHGCQYTPRYANQIIEYVNETNDLFAIKTLEYDELVNKGLLEILGEEMDASYLKSVKTVSLNPSLPKPLKIVFTPLHGTSGYLGERLLKEMNYSVFPVPEQMINDPDFPTVELPNPEEKSAFKLAEKLGKEINADLLIATDPDADRLGIGVLDQGEFVYLNGNQTGAIMIYYLLNELKKQDKLPKKGVVYNTIVTSNLGGVIAKSFGMDVFSTLTGFKFIGEQARYIEDTEKEFVFGYEESYGYVVKDFVRDKDSLQAILLIAEAANYYRTEEQKTLVEKLEDIYQTYGYYYEGLKNIKLLGKAGQERISRVIDEFRNHSKTTYHGKSVSVKEDFDLSVRYIDSREEEITLPKSNVIKFTLEDGSWFVLRPSGTEPKLKIYAGVIGQSLDDAVMQVNHLLEEVNQIVSEIE